MPYIPPEHIVNIAALLSGEPIAHFERADGTIVIVMRDGRKIIYTLPAPSQADAQAETGAPKKPARRPTREKKP